MPRRLLVIEDSPTLVEGLLEYWRAVVDPPPTVTVAASLADGMVQVERLPLDVLIVDLTLTDSGPQETLDGLRAVLETRPRDRPLPVILMSGYGDEMRLKALGMGFPTFVTKGPRLGEHLWRLACEVYQAAQTHFQRVQALGAGG